MLLEGYSQPSNSKPFAATILSGPEGTDSVNPSRWGCTQGGMGAGGLLPHRRGGGVYIPPYSGTEDHLPGDHAGPDHAGPRSQRS